MLALYKTVFTYCRSDTPSWTNEELFGKQYQTPDISESITIRDSLLLVVGSYTLDEKKAWQHQRKCIHTHTHTATWPSLWIGLFLSQYALSPSMSHSPAKRRPRDRSRERKGGRGARGSDKVNTRHHNDDGADGGGGSDGEYKYVYSSYSQAVSDMYSSSVQENIQRELAVLRKVRSWYMCA